MSILFLLFILLLEMAQTKEITYWTWLPCGRDPYGDIYVNGLRITNNVINLLLYKILGFNV